MADTAWMRFQKIMHDGKFVVPVAPMRFISKGKNECEVRTTHRVYSYEAVDFAISASGSDGWIIKLESPTKEGQEYVWKFTKG